MPPVDAEQIRTILASKQFHAELDIKGAFQKIRSKVSDIWKSAFNAMGATYKTPVAQQGDTNSTVSLALMMQYILEGLIGQSLLTYADNIFVYGDTWHELRFNVIEALRRCRIHSWCVNSNSVRICPNEVEVLGIKVAYGNIRASTEMRDTILMMHTPHDQKSLQRFEGSVQWLARFIPHLAEIAAPLTDLAGNAPCPMALDTSA